MAVLTSLGMINCLGSTPEVIWEQLLSGWTGGLKENAESFGQKATCTGAINCQLPRVPSHLAEFQSRYYALCEGVCQQIADKVLQCREVMGAKRVGVIVGSSTSGIDAGEEAYSILQETGKFPASYNYIQQEMGGPSEYIRRRFELLGPSYTISTACTSGAKALAAAARLLEHGVCDAVITGGVDTLCALTVRGFGSLGLLSSNRCMPFSANRKGLNLGEGACLFVMERQGKGVALLGVGESSDAYHMSTPHPSGQGIALAIRNSLGNAAVLPTEITYVNLHGTGTLLNDQGEGKAIAETLGTTVPVSSTKAMTGHLLGAAGSTEAGFCYLIVQSRKSFEQDRDMIKLPPHCWDGHLDPLIPPLHFVGKESRISRPIRLICLSVSAAFGGSNCALLFGETEG